MEVGKRCGSNVPSPRKRGEGYFLAMWNSSAPLPACGERVPKAGEGPTEPRSLALQGGSSVAKQRARMWRCCVTGQCPASARPSSARWAPSPRKRGEGCFLAMWNGSTPLPACGERVPKAGEGRRSRCVSRLHNAFEAGVARIRPAAASGERGADRSRCPGCAALTRATRLPTGGEKAWVCSPCARVMRRGESPRLRASSARQHRERPRMRTRKVRHQAR
jgi:hypothetical protein